MRDTKERWPQRSEIDQHVYGKVPPQALEIEDVILGQMLLEANCIPTVMSILTVNSFYKQSNQQIFTAISNMYDSGKQIDLLTVAEYLRSTGALENAGGAYYITMLTDRVSSSANIEEHCRILLERQIKREIIKSTSETLEMAYDNTTDAFDCLTTFERAATNINSIITSGNNMRTLANILDEVELEAKKRERLYNQGICTGISTGLSKLNKRTNGWQNGDLIILAGRPSMGKTALMLHHALSAGVSVCIYSLEMSAVSLLHRLILSVGKLDASRFRAGAFNEHEWNEFYKAKASLSELPIYVDDNPSVTARYIKSHSKLMKDKGMCDIVFVDYLQLTDMRSDQKGRNREQEVSQTTREMKIIAKSLNIPVILLSQLSRACELRADKKPILSDLRESGAIEQDADIVIFTYRPEYYGLTDKDGNSQEGIGYEIIAKGRNIGLEEIPFSYNQSMTKIFDYEPNQYDLPVAEKMPF